MQKCTFALQFSTLLPSFKLNPGTTAFHAHCEDVFLLSNSLQSLYTFVKTQYEANTCHLDVKSKGSNSLYRCKFHFSAKAKTADNPGKLQIFTHACRITYIL